MSIKYITAAFLLFMLGLTCGGYLFSQTTPRSFLAFNDCQSRCYKPNELAGLFASAAVLRASDLMPGVVMESDACLAIRYPAPTKKAHYILFPKHDTRNITTLTPADSPYVLGCFALARELVKRDKLETYFLRTNGPGLQDVTYLHFHLVAD